MKKLSLFIVLAALIGLSSCQSLRIDKRHYSNGWYVDFGNDKKSQAPVAKEETEEAPVVVQEQLAEENAAPAEEPENNGSPAEQKLSYNNGESSVVVAPTQNTDEPVTDQQNKSTAVEENKMNKENGGPAVSAADDRLILLVILAILIPPLAVYLKEGVTPMFWITLICWLIGGAFLFGRFGYGYIGGLGLLAVVLALLVVFDVI